MAKGRKREVLFKIFYSTSFTVVFLLLLAFIVLTPTDTVYESYKNGNYVDIIIVAAVYVLTALLALLIYASRLYTNRSVLKDIPKAFMPIEKEDLPGKRVRRLIVESLERSVVIAYQARPRSKRIEDESPEVRDRIANVIGTEPSEDVKKEPTWGAVAHPGWSSPASPDLPDLQYDIVIKELTDLIEAKAVSLAPVDPLATPSIDGTPMPDESVIEILQRPAETGMRQYFGRLVALGVVEDTLLSRDFLALYERARFSGQMLKEDEFRRLMGMFAEVLRGMSTLDTEEIE